MANTNWIEVPLQEESNTASWKKISPLVQAERDAYAQQLQQGQGGTPAFSNTFDVTSPTAGTLSIHDNDLNRPGIPADARAALLKEIGQVKKGPVPKQTASKWTEVPLEEEEKKPFKFGKEIGGLFTGMADIASGIGSLPISGLVGAASLPFVGAERSAELIHKTQEMLTPSAALKKEGLGTTDSGTHQILMKIIGAPSEYLTQPIADAYFKLKGEPLSAAILKATLDIPAYILAFKGAKGIAEVGARPRSAETLRTEAGYGGPEVPKPQNVTPEGFAPDLPFGEQRLPVRSPYNVLPEELRKQLEAELNPPLETRVPGQGELFTNERPYEQGELLQGRPGEMSPPQTSIKNRLEPFDTTLDPSRQTRMGETTSQEGFPYEQTPIPKETRQPQQMELVEQSLKKAGEQLKQLEFSMPLSERGSVGESRSRVAEENTRRAEQEKLNSEGISTEGFQPAFDAAKTIFRGPGSRQKGAVDPKVLTEGLRKLKDYLTKDPNVMKDDLGSAAIVFRGSHGGKHDPRTGSKGTFGGTGTSGYTAVFTSDNPYTASTFADPFIALPGRPNNANVTPFILKPTKILEFVPKTSHKSGWINWWDFDKQAEKLGKGEVLVARKSLDFGSAVGWDSPKNRDRALNDQYAFSDPNVAIPLFEYLNQQKPISGLGTKQSGALRLDNMFQKKGVAQTLINQRKIFDKQPETAAEVMKGMVEQKTPDVTYAGKIAANVGIPRQAAILTGNPLVNWSVTKTQDIYRESKQAIKSDIEGEKYIANQYGLERRVPDETKGLTLLRRNYRNSAKTRQDMIDMKNVWLEHVGKSDPTRADFKTENQWQTYSAMAKSLSERLDSTNAERVKSSLPVIPKLPGYFPAMREGDYAVRVFDSQGKVIWREGESSQWAADRLKNALKNKFPDMKIEAKHTEKSRYDISDTSSWEEAAEILSREGNTALSKAFNRIAADVMTHRGAGKHGIHRTFVQGFMGMEPGKLGIQNMERAFESYVTKLNHYEANLKISRLKGELEGLPTEFKTSQENALKFSQDYLDHARGKELNGDYLGVFAEVTGRLAGLGANSAKRGIGNLAQTILPMWLTTPRQIMANLAQPFVNNAQIAKLNALGETNVNPIVAYFEGISERINPDKTSIEGRNWLARKGYSDPTITTATDTRMSNFLESSTRNLQVLKEFSHWPSAKIEQFGVRIPSFHIYEKALRHSIPDKETRFRKAAELMDDRMVNYDSINTPLMYNRAGILGDAAKPLKQYSHNAWGQFFDYAQFAKDTGKLAPLAWHLGTSLALTGLKGAVLVAEATAIINLLNARFDTDIPTPLQWFHSVPWLPDALIQGGFSTALGYDISSSVSHPGFPQMLSLPGVELGAKWAQETVNFIIKTAKGTATDADAMRAWLVNTPSGPIHNWIEELYTPEGGFVPNANDPNLKGTYQRSTEEKIIGGLSGLRSTQREGQFDGDYWSGGKIWDHLVGKGRRGEAQAREMASSAKQLLMRDAKQKIEAISAITDRIQNGEEIPPELLQKYIQEGGSASRLTQDVKGRIEDQSLSPAERPFKRGGMTPDKAHKLEVLKNLMEMELRDQKKSPKSGEGKGGWKEVPLEEGELKPIGLFGGQNKRAIEGKWHQDLAKKTNPKEKPVPMPESKHNFRLRDSMPRPPIHPDGTIMNNEKGYFRGTTEI